MSYRIRLKPLSAARLRGLRTYTAAFHSVFSRADQRQRLETYLHGLLDGEDGKNAEAIAARLDGGSAGGGLAQALQHFVSVSPWDTRRFLQCYREQLAPHFRVEDGVLVVQDVVFPRKGRHGVGVQRQLARSLGRKVSCQVGVAVSQISSDGFVPLAMQIFLPASWLRDRQQDVERTVPPEQREHRTKVDIALGLLEQIRAEGWNSPIVAEEGYETNSAFQEELLARNWPLLPGSVENQSAGSTGPLPEAQAGYEWLKTHLGLGQFEGRSWHGWHHHVSLSLAAYGFLLLGQPRENLARPSIVELTELAQP